MDYNRIAVMIGIGIVVSMSAIAIIAFAGSVVSTDYSSEQTTDVQTTTIPPVVENVSNDVESFKRNLTKRGYDVRVYVGERGDVLVEYNTSAQTESALRDEVETIATTYAPYVENESRMRTLTVRVGNVTAIVSPDVARAYERGDLKRSAFVKTIQYT